MSSKRASVTALEDEEIQHVKPEPVPIVKGPSTNPSRRDSGNTIPGTGDLPFKLFMNEKDGVIDVDVASPKSDASSLENMSSIDFFYLTGEVNFHKIDSHHNSNVAGYLPALNQDVSIQAVRPYDDLKRHIKRAMSAEPTPIFPRSKVPPTTSSMEDRIPLATTLIIDLCNMTIKRLSLSRHVRLRPSTETPSIPAHRRRDAAPVCIPETLGESFTEEVISSTSAEPVLVKLVERLLLAQNNVSGLQTRGPSLSGSVKQRGQTDRMVDVSKAVPRQEVKGAVIATLSEIVDDVLAEADGRGAAVEGVAKGSLLRESLRKIVKEQRVVA